MLTLASQTFVDGVWTLTPEEPATLQLAVVGFAMLATYAVVTGWRPTRRPVKVRATIITEGQPTTEEKIRRAA